MTSEDLRMLDSVLLHKSFKKLKIDEKCCVCKIGSEADETSNKKNCTKCSKTIINNPSVSIINRKLIRDAKLKLTNFNKTRKTATRGTHKFDSKPLTTDCPNQWPTTQPCTGNNSDDDSVFGESSFNKITDYADIASNRRASKRPSSYMDHFKKREMRVNNSVPREPVVVPSQIDIRLERSCSQEAHMETDDYSVMELAGYFEDCIHIPKKMSVMAEMMYT